jgi:hypothetical protein
MSYTEKNRKEQLARIEGTEEEMERFLTDLERYFTQTDTVFHYFIDESINCEFLDTCLKLKLILSKYNCLCETEGERQHRHYLVFMNNGEKKLKHPSLRLTRHLRKRLNEQNLAQSSRPFYGMKIKSPSHLVNSAVYIQTRSCFGKHRNQNKTENKHTSQRVNPVIPNMKAQKVFKQDVLFPRIPGLRKTSWQIKKEKKEEEKLKEKLREDTFNILFVAN